MTFTEQLKAIFDTINKIKIKDRMTASSIELLKSQLKILELLHEKEINHGHE